MKKLLKYLNKKELVLLVMAMMIIVSSISYAFYLAVVSQEGENEISSACFRLTMEEEDEIGLEKTYPLSEEEGSKLRPFKFTIKNICNKAANYQLNIETLNESTLETEYIRYKLDEKESKILGEEEEVNTYVNNEAKESRKISEGILLKNESKTYNLRLWLDEEAEASETSEKTYVSKVVVISELNKNPNVEIAINTNGGTISNDRINAIERKELGEIEEPERVGYVFLGWFKDEELTQGVASDTIVDKELTNIYASWTKGRYELEVELDGGTYNKETQLNIEYESEYDLGEPTRVGYTFAGWEIEEGNSTLNGNILRMGSEKTKVKAKWNINSYKLTIDRNNGSEEEERILDYNSEITLIEPSKEGYTFTGWNNIEKLVGLRMPAEDVRISAEYVVNNYKYIVYHKKMNLDGETYTITDTEEGNKAYHTTFSGTLQNYTGFTNPTLQTKQIEVEEVYPPETNKIEYNYTRNKYQLTIDKNGGTGGSNSQELYYEESITLSNPTKEGYNLGSWTKISGDVTISGNNITMGSSSSEIKANWNANKYTITFNVNGGNALSTTDQTKEVTYASTYGTLPTPTRTGYTFNGWFTASSGGTKKTSSTTVSITAAETLYAQWTKNKYTITFNVNGGNALSTTDQTKEVTYASTYGTLPTPTRTGYTFAGWSRNLTDLTYTDNYTFSSFQDRTSLEFKTGETIDSMSNQNYFRINGYQDSNNIDTTWRLVSKNTFNIKSNTQYLISMYIRANNSVSSQYMNSLYGTQGYNGFKLSNGSLQMINENVTFDNDGNWHLIHLNITMPNNSDGSVNLSLGNDIPNTFGIGSYIDIANIQVTEGTEYTPYIIDNNTNVTLLDNHTLYAKWIKN